MVALSAHYPEQAPGPADTYQATAVAERADAADALAPLTSAAVSMRVQVKGRISASGVHEDVQHTSSCTPARQCRTLAPQVIFTKIDMRSELVGMAGFEPAASCSQSRRANQAAPHPVEPAEAYPVGPVVGVPHGQARGRCPLVGHIGCRARPGYLDGMKTVRYGVAAEPPRGRSSMVEPQPSKLVMRVRFPSPAPT